MTDKSGEDWHINKEATVLIAVPGDGPGGAEFHLHESAATGEAKTRADIILSAVVKRVYNDEAWLNDLLSWGLDNSNPQT